VQNSISAGEIMPPTVTGKTSILKECGVPGHPFAVGVMVMVAVMGTFPLFMAVKPGIFPVPDAPSPMAGLLFTQVKEVPVTGPVIGVGGTEEPVQTDWLLTVFTVAVG
jgi:hypothetical protein